MTLNTLQGFVVTNNIIWNVINSNKCESPAQSPDLNPIEIIWADLKAYVRSKCCRTTYELNNAIAEYKKTLTPEKCGRFISHLKKVWTKTLIKIFKRNNR